MMTKTMTITMTTQTITLALLEKDSCPALPIGPFSPPSEMTMTMTMTTTTTMTMTLAVLRIPRLVKLNEKSGNMGEKLIGFKYKVIWQR